MMLLAVLVVIAFLLWYLLPRQSRSEARGAANRIFRIVAWVALILWISCVVGFFFSIGDFKPGTETAVPIVGESIGFIFGFAAWAIGSIGVLATRRKVDRPSAPGHFRSQGPMSALDQ
jgi:protein-S-isoprenylcysteine O-methyltransferase Ste14